MSERTVIKRGLIHLALKKFAFPLYLFLASEGEFYTKEFLLLQKFTFD